MVFFVGPRATKTGIDPIPTDLSLVIPRADELEPPPLSKESLHLQPPATQARVVVYSMVRDITGPIVAAPLKRVTTLLQAQDAIPRIYKSELGGGGESVRYLGIRDSLRRLIREQGARSLWRGTIVSVGYRTAFYSTLGVSMGLTESLTGKARHGDHVGIAARIILATTVHGLLAGTVFYPLQFAAIRRRADIERPLMYRNSFHCWRQIITQVGSWRAVYAGVGPIATSEVLTSAGFGLFLSRSLFLPEHENGDAALYVIGASLHTLLVHPLRTIGTRLAVQSGAQTMLYRGTLDCIRKLWREGGLLAFYKGGLASFAGSIVAFSALDGLVKALGTATSLVGAGDTSGIDTDRIKRRQPKTSLIDDQTYTPLFLRPKEENMGVKLPTTTTTDKPLSPIVSEEQAVDLDEQRERERLRKARENQWT